MHLWNGGLKLDSYNAYMPILLRGCRSRKVRIEGSGRMPAHTQFPTQEAAECLVGIQVVGLPTEDMPPGLGFTAGNPFFVDSKLNG